MGGAAAERAIGRKVAEVTMQLDRVDGTTTHARARELLRSLSRPQSTVARAVRSRGGDSGGGGWWCRGKCAHS
jgi:hypothetical protein